MSYDVLSSRQNFLGLIELRPLTINEATANLTTRLQDKFNLSYSGRKRTKLRKRTGQSVYPNPNPVNMTGQDPDESYFL